MFLANRLIIPNKTAALLLDLDGVIIDSLGLDFAIVGRYLDGVAVVEDAALRSLIRANFAYDLTTFWTNILTGLGVAHTADQLTGLVERHEAARETTQMQVLEGASEVIEAAREAGLPLALVSNNSREHLDKILANAGLSGCFAAVIGNDAPDQRRKPAPDPYLAAAAALGVDPAACVAVEDSLLGAASASSAGCTVVGVATGSADFGVLAGAPGIATVYRAFTPCRVALGWRGVTAKAIDTPNDFMSHMLEHIAWRMGCSIDVAWSNNDWFALGHEAGAQIAGLLGRQERAVAFGMMDDGSAEVTVDPALAAGVHLSASGAVDLDWFLDRRCEQVHTGHRLVQLLAGIAEGCGARVDVLVVSAEDPHHTWEAIFRGVGIAFGSLTEGPLDPPDPPLTARSYGWSVGDVSSRAASVTRTTAESVASVDLTMGHQVGAACSLETNDSIDVAGLPPLLQSFGAAAGLHLAVTFAAPLLSSSHVVMEDVGMTLGRAVAELATYRMRESGIQGAGSTLGAEPLPVQVGVSMEGRKFWRFVPMDGEISALRRRFLVGQTLASGLFSEDLDDFIDGFSGGLAGSVMIHVAQGTSAEEGWPLVFEGLGAAVAEMLRENPRRRGLTPGVKATLA